MKKFTTLFQTTFVLFLLAMTSCSNDDNSGLTEPINTAEIKLFVIDTARVNTINNMGTNEVTILNKSVNSSSYIGDFSISPDGKHFIYVNHQLSGVVPDLVFIKEIRKANIDGTGDSKIYEVPDAQTEIVNIRYCSDDKIVFSTQKYMEAFVVTQNHLMNADGTGLEDLQNIGVYVDISDDRNYFLSNTETGFQIFDADLDNGIPGLYYSENVSSADQIGSGVFTNDGKTVVIPYKEGNSIKAKVIDMATKVSNTIELISGINAQWVSFHLEMASDGKRGVVTLAGDFDHSKTYIFNSVTGVVQPPFENNDDNIFDVYVW